MKIENVRTEEVSTITAIQCDRCGHKASPSEEGCEYLSYRDVGGYFSKYDMCVKEVDLCEKCTMELLGQWMRITGPGGERITKE